MAAIAAAIPCAFFQLAPTPPPKNSPARRQPPPPISISTNPSHLDPLALRDLLTASGLSCHRFPALAADGRPEPVDVGKLRLALAHSSIVVSVFCRPKFLEDEGGGREDAPVFGLGDLLERAVPANESERRLVGFGRAVSDGGLTASIHDVVYRDPAIIHAIISSDFQVAPSLRKLGIGRRIVDRIVRVLTNKGIYDISALCSQDERFFFKACGFGEDYFGSTTMMYTRSVLDKPIADNIVRPAGRMLLLVPPLREPYVCTSTAAKPDSVDKVQ